MKASAEARAVFWLSARDLGGGGDGLEDAAGADQGGGRDDEGRPGDCIAFHRGHSPWETWTSGTERRETRTARRTSVASPLARLFSTSDVRRWFGRIREICKSKPGRQSTGDHPASAGPGWRTVAARATVVAIRPDVEEIFDPRTNMPTVWDPRDQTPDAFLARAATARSPTGPSAGYLGASSAGHPRPAELGAIVPGPATALATRSAPCPG